MPSGKVTANPYLFVSERLGFRVFQNSDLEEFAQINADPRVMEFFPDVESKEESAASIQRYQKSQKQNGYSAYAVDLLENQEFIGYMGMMNPSFKAHFMPCTEIGWRLKAEYWNKGFGSEGARACLNYAFNTLQISEIVSFTAVINTKSERVMQKIGLKKAGTFKHPNLPQNHPLELHVLYKISQEEFKLLST